MGREKVAVYRSRQSRPHDPVMTVNGIRLKEVKAASLPSFLTADMSHVTQVFVLIH